MLENSKPAPEEDAETNEQNRNEERYAIDEAISVLAVERRRTVVEYLDEHSPVEFRTLAEVVAESEFGPSYDSQERKRVYVALYQSHIPKMKDYDVITSEDKSGHIRKGPEFETTVRYLRALQRVERQENPEASSPRFRTLRTFLSG